MQIGMIGLGRMGANMVRRLLRGGHECVVNDRNPEAVKTLEGEGATGDASLDVFIAKLKPPRAIWLMIPAALVDTMIHQLLTVVEAGDIIIDGGNSYYIDDIRRARELKDKGIHYVDVGTSGGVWGLERGYCQMIGGEKDVVARLDPIFKTLAPGRDAVPERRRGREGALADLPRRCDQRSWKRHALELHRAQGIGRNRRRADVPAPLAVRRQDRIGSQGQGSSREALLSPRAEGEGCEGGGAGENHRRWRVKD